VADLELVTYLAELFRSLKDGDICTRSSQGDSGCQTTNSGTDNANVNLLWSLILIMSFVFGLEGLFLLTIVSDVSLVPS
jgi:hypothetical protein